MCCMQWMKHPFSMTALTVNVRLPFYPSLGAISHTVRTSSQFYVRPIVWSNVQCSGLEERLMDCTELGGRRCTHREDAGVTCQAHTGA